jgi:hypothetical protein
MEEQVEAHFGEHPDAEIYLSQPGLGVVLGARVLAEFGDDKTRYADARARRGVPSTRRAKGKPSANVSALISAPTSCAARYAWNASDVNR